MNGSELIVALFALVFLAFCLTAIALIAMSKDKDDIASKSVSALRSLKDDRLPAPLRARDQPQNDGDEPAED